MADTARSEAGPRRRVGEMDMKAGTRSKRTGEKLETGTERAWQSLAGNSFAEVWVLALREAVSVARIILYATLTGTRKGCSASSNRASGAVSIHGASRTKRRAPGPSVAVLRMHERRMGATKFFARNGCICVTISDVDRVPFTSQRVVSSLRIGRRRISNTCRSHRRGGHAL